MHEFVCEHCGVLVVAVVAEPHPENVLCSECRFVEGIEDEAAREQARDFLRRVNHPGQEE